MPSNNDRVGKSLSSLLHKKQTPAQLRQRARFRRLGTLVRVKGSLKCYVHDLDKSDPDYAIWLEWVQNAREAVDYLLMYAEGVDRRA